MAKEIKIIRELPPKFKEIREINQTSSMASHPAPDFELEYEKPKLAEFLGI